MMMRYHKMVPHLFCLHLGRKTILYTSCYVGPKWDCEDLGIFLVGEVWADIIESLAEMYIAPTGRKDTYKYEKIILLEQRWILMNWPSVLSAERPQSLHYHNNGFELRKYLKEYYDLFWYSQVFRGSLLLSRTSLKSLTSDLNPFNIMAA